MIPLIPASIHDEVGLTGVFLVLLCYGLLQTGRLGQSHPLYSILNALGAVLIFLSLTVSFNLASVVIEICWFTISMVGLYRSLKGRKIRHPRI
jgi:hypothetical protein